MPGPISQSYEGPSDDKPKLPEWAFQSPTQGVAPRSEPATHEEARWFHEGFLAGATAYCAAIGHSCLKSDNEKLREVFDAQGWKTIEMFEKLANAPEICEHGIPDGDWCEPCNKEMKDARREQLEGFDCHAGFAPGSRGRPSVPEEIAQPIRDAVAKIHRQHGLTTTNLKCADCGEVSSNPGQFLRDGRWVCTERCRRELCDAQSYDDLSASGGIVDAP